jgi:GAF domain-containing protein
MSSLANISFDEQLRLEELSHYYITCDTPEEQYTELASLASQFMHTPFAGMSLVDKNHIWLKARVGLEATCLEREQAFCSYAVESNHNLFIVPDTLQDLRFVNNPLVKQSPHIRFYAGAVLMSHRGYPLGTLWLMDTKPRTLREDDQKALLGLAALAARLLELCYRNPITKLPNRNTFITNLQHTINLHNSDLENLDNSPAYQFDYPKSNSITVGFIHVRNLPLVTLATKSCNV